MNTLEWPAAVFPTGLTVDAALDKKPATFEAANETEEQVYSICKQSFDRIREEFD